MSVESSAPLVDAGTALNSLRDSDFDCYSAIGEVIDNSVQAKATEVKVELKAGSSSGGGSDRLREISFFDNGTGMPADIVQSCLTLGMSSRYDNRKGIGRFGVGMTLGAIHECRRVEVYSKIAGGSWLYTYLDLDEVASGSMSALPEVVAKNPSHHRDACSSADSGTVVVWKKLDRIRPAMEDLVPETKFYIGRTYRRFIWGTAEGYPAVQFEVNGTVVQAFDPLFLTKEFTAVPNDAVAEDLGTENIEWSYHDAEGRKQTSIVKLTMSFLPESLRPKSMWGNTPEAQARHIHRNEGISIMRNDREVFSGHLPWSRKSLGYSSETDRMKTRYIGLEISFSAELDSFFEVKNIKRGAKPIGDLRARLYESIRPCVKTYLQKLTDYWKKVDREENGSQDLALQERGIVTDRKKINRKIKTVDITPSAGKTDPKRTDEAIAKRVNSELQGQELEGLIEELKRRGIIVQEKEWPGNTFVAMEQSPSVKALFWNTNSSFYKNYRTLFDEVANQNEENAEEYQFIVDILMVSFMLAESDLSSGQRTSEEWSGELRDRWSLRMTELCRKMSGDE